MSEGQTSFITIYDSFFNRVTDIMYMEFTVHDTYIMLQELLINALPRFEFPRFDIFDYEEGYIDNIGTYCGIESDGITVPATAWVGGAFNSTLTKEEVNILSLAMVIEWLGQQLATTENTKLKYSGSDYKFSSQANHMSKLKVMINQYNQDCFHLQRLYKRRKVVDGEVRSTANLIMTTPTYGLNID